MHEILVWSVDAVYESNTFIFPNLYIFTWPKCFFFPMLLPLLEAHCKNKWPAKKPSHWCVSRTTPVYGVPGHSWTFVNVVLRCEVFREVTKYLSTVCLRIFIVFIFGHFCCVVVVVETLEYFMLKLLELGNIVWLTCPTNGQSSSCRNSCYWRWS